MFLGCGRWELNDSSLLSRLLAGNSSDEDVGSANFEEDPWPSLAYLFNVRTKTSCTVSIFSPRWLLASHRCVTDK